MREKKTQEQLLEEVRNASIALSTVEIEKLKKMLIDYCEIYYSNLPIFSVQNRVHLDNALNWAIKRIEQRINPRVSSTGELVIGDGTWLGNAQNYYKTLVQSKPDIGFYLNEYLNSGLINVTTIINNSTMKR